jgi:peptide/nickel transport system ATP-binding protein
VSDSDDETVVSLQDIEVHLKESSGFVERLFGGGDTVRAVDGVSLEIGENEVVAPVGESGYGKTTLGKTAVGIQRPTGGSVKYRGQDIWAAKEKRGDVEIPFKEIRRSLQRHCLVQHLLGGRTAI